MGNRTVTPVQRQRDRRPEREQVCLGNAEVIPEQPLQQHASGHDVEPGEDEDGRLCRGHKGEIVQQKDDKKDDGENDFKALPSAELELIFVSVMNKVTSNRLVDIGRATSSRYPDINLRSLRRFLPVVVPFYPRTNLSTDSRILHRHGVR